MLMALPVTLVPSVNWKVPAVATEASRASQQSKIMTNLRIYVFSITEPSAQ
jgi:hypothetical protein